MIRGYYDNHGKFRGFSNNLEGVYYLILILLPLAIILLAVFFPAFLGYQISHSEEDIALEKKLKPEELENLRQQNTWYPWHRYKIAYTVCLVIWVIVFINSLIH